ncbi:MAG TPA: nickel-type superoxide dismutase maturation protease [Acidimicrobiales bacterium]|nr:nickel-type superoxide dismutase maturation protease [Acidimicrobiales bacterium]
MRRTIGATIALVVVALAYGAHRLVSRVEVAGESMAPTLVPGDRLLVVRWPASLAPWPAPGQVVAVRDPRQPARVLVKRVGSVDRDRGTVEVLGDHPGASTDSRDFGPVPRALVVGTAVYRYAPPGRIGSGPWHPGYDRSEGEPSGRPGSDPTGPSSATKGTA